MKKKIRKKIILKYLKTLISEIIKMSTILKIAID